MLCAALSCQHQACCPKAGLTLGLEVPPTPPGAPLTTPCLQQERVCSGTKKPLTQPVVQVAQGGLEGTQGRRCLPCLESCFSLPRLNWLIKCQFDLPTFRCLQSPLVNRFARLQRKPRAEPGGGEGGEP